MKSHHYCHMSPVPRGQCGGGLRAEHDHWAQGRRHGTSLRVSSCWRSAETRPDVGDWAEILAAIFLARKEWLAWAETPQLGTRDHRQSSEGDSLLVWSVEQSEGMEGPDPVEVSDLAGDGAPDEVQLILSS